jgi:hypothetical protein
VIECIAYKSVNYGARGWQGGRDSFKIVICRYLNPCVSCTVTGKITAHGVAMHYTLSVILAFSIHIAFAMYILYVISRYIKHVRTTYNL